MPHPVPFIKLFKYASSKDLILMGVANLFILYSSINIPLVNIVYGLMMREMNDYVAAREKLPEAESKFMNNSYHLCMIVIVFGITRFVALYLALLFFSRAAANQAKRVKILFFKSLLRQEIAWFERNRTGDFALRISSDLSKFEDGIGEKIALCFNALFAWLSSLVSSFYYGWELTSVCLVLVPLTIFTTTVIAEFQAKFSIKESSALSRAFNVCHEVISSIRTVLSFSGQEKEAGRFKNSLDSAYKYGLNRNIFAALNLGFTWMSGYLGFAICLLYSTKFYKPEYVGQYDEAHIITILWSAAGCVFLLNRMMPFIEIIQMARGSASNLFSVIERKSLIDVTSKEGLSLTHFKAHVKFDNVFFTYPNSLCDDPEDEYDEEEDFEDINNPLSRSNRNRLRRRGAIDGLTMEVRSGQTIALVGPSGSGKSTALALLQRFYDIDSGSITLDGHPINSFNLAWLRGQFGVVTQEPVLFDMSIADNIRLGARPGQMLTDYDIEQAARNANAHAFITRLPAGYGTRVGSRGIQLSGGQKQRIAIARALVRQPKILLLDEATSALDLESESVVQKALDHARIGRTTFIVAHRLSTVRNADRIIVFDRGAIVEQGSHEELLAKRGLYHQISSQQRHGLDLLHSGRRNSQINSAGCGLGGLGGLVGPVGVAGDPHLGAGSAGGHFTRESRSLSIYSTTGKYAASATATGGFGFTGHGGNGEGVDNGESCANETNHERYADDNDFYNQQNGDSDTSGQDKLLAGCFFNEETQASLLDNESQLLLVNNKGKQVANLSVAAVIRFIKPHLGWSLVGIITSLLMGLCIPISAMIIGELATIFSTDSAEKIRQGLWSHGLLYTVLALFAFLVSFIQVVSFGVAGEKIGAQLRLRGFEAIMRRDITWFDQKRNNPGSVCTRLASDVGNVQSITGNRTAVIFQSISILVSTLVFAVYYNAKFSALCAMFVAILLISTVMQARYAGKLAMASRNFDSRVGKIVLESSANIRTLVSLHQEQYFIEKCELVIARDRRSNSLDNHLKLSLESLKYAMTAISKGSSFFFAAQMLINNEITIDTIFKLIEIILYGLTEASKSLIFIGDLEKARRGTQNLYKLIYGVSPTSMIDGLPIQQHLEGPKSGGCCAKSLGFTGCLTDSPPDTFSQGGALSTGSKTSSKVSSGATVCQIVVDETAEELEAGEDPETNKLLAVKQQQHHECCTNRCQGNIKFQGVRFHYPSRPDAAVLKSFSIEIPAGKSIALVGRSGCGKSTIVQLLEKFYEQSSGDIYLDGREIRRLPVEWLRSQIGLVSQEPTLLSYSIADNIRYGDNSRYVGLDEVVRAAQVADIHDFIMGLPERYDTQLSESNSVQLSGGQKQRIAIARALVKQAPILVFDEATSALDTKSEQAVQEALDRARVGKTSIIIAHRLSTIKTADRIVVLRDGMVVEQGSHEELLERRGEYYCLYNNQTRP